jgi:hypothetical protein
MTGGMESLFWSVVDTWLTVKTSLEQSLPFSSAWLHIVIGPLVFLAAAALLRKPVTSWLPWLVLALLALLNEVADIVPHRWPDGPRRFIESGRDFALSMLVSTLILLVARWRRSKSATRSLEIPTEAGERAHCEPPEAAEAPSEATPD